MSDEVKTETAEQELARELAGAEARMRGTQFMAAASTIVAMLSLQTILWAMYHDRLNSFGIMGFLVSAIGAVTLWSMYLTESQTVQSYRHLQLMRKVTDEA